MPGLAKDDMLQRLLEDERAIQGPLEDERVIQGRLEDERAKAGNVPVGDGQLESTTNLPTDRNSETYTLPRYVKERKNSNFLLLTRFFLRLPLSFFLGEV